MTTVLRSRTRVAHCADSLPDDLLQMLWSRPEALVALGEPMRHVGVRNTVRLRWASNDYVIKHYVEPTWRHALKRTVQRSRAWTAWSASHRLAEAGIATPRPVACVENRWGALRRDSFLMYPYVPGCTLRSYLASEQGALRSTLVSLWCQLTGLWEQLRRLRVSLSDANAANFIVSPAGQLWVIDLDKVRFHIVAFRAAWQQHRGWNQMLRSAAQERSTPGMNREVVAGRLPVA